MRRYLLSTLVLLGLAGVASAQGSTPKPTPAELAERDRQRRNKEAQARDNEPWRVKERDRIREEERRKRLPPAPSPKPLPTSVGTSIDIDPERLERERLERVARAESALIHANTIESWDEAIRLNPNLPDAFFKRGKFFESKNDYKNAIADYSQAIGLNLQDFDVFYRRGHAYQRVNQYDSAIEDYKMAEELAYKGPQGDVKLKMFQVYLARGELNFFGTHNYRSAQFDFARATFDNPTSAYAFLMKGRAGMDMLRGGPCDDAIILDFSQAIKLNPPLVDAYEAYMHRGICYQRLGQHESAIKDYSAALLLMPHDVDLHRWRISEYVQLRRYDSALQDLDQLVERCANSQSAGCVLGDYPFTIRGWAYHGKGMYDLAIKEFDRAIALQGDAGNFFSRGNSYYAKGQYKRAIQDFDAAIQRYPNYAEAVNLRNRALQKLGASERQQTERERLARLERERPERAKEALNRGEYDEAIRLNPDLPGAYLGRAGKYFINGQYDRAIQDYDQAVRLDPSWGAFYWRGDTYNAKRQYDLAIRDCDQAIQLNPNAPDAFYCRGQAYVGSGQYDRAIQDYNQAIRLQSQSSDFAKSPGFIQRGAAYHAKGEYDLAIQDYDQAIRLWPFVAAFCARGRAYDAKGQYDRAIQDYDQAIRGYPNFAEAFYARGIAKQHKGDKAGGEADIARAKQLDPKVGQ